MLFFPDFSLIQAMLYANYNISIRGSVTIGDLNSENDSFIFGPGIVKAYIIENEKAIYPRIIIDDVVFDEPMTETRHFKSSIDSAFYLEYGNIKDQLYIEINENDKMVKVLNFYQYLDVDDLHYINEGRFENVDFANKVKEIICGIYNVSSFERSYLDKCIYENTINNIKVYKDNEELLSKYLWYILFGYCHYGLDENPLKSRYSLKKISDKIGFNLINMKVNLMESRKKRKTERDIYNLLKDIPDEIPD